VRAADGVAATHLPQHEDAKDDLHGVVGYQDGVQLEGLPVGHQTRTQHQHQVQVHCHYYHCRYRTLHEGPVVDPGICNSRSFLIVKFVGIPASTSFEFGVHSCQQKSIGLKFSKSQTGSYVRYGCHHNSSRFTFPIFAHSCRFSVLHSLQSITPRIY